ncbi:uncharacterized protein LOC133355618 isoform X5 [Lethenteron reissneri]|uniref:uncharacterized protein LOC133355618 isoform X5 n=1 Tax=Lethenteron reissneri TaxID=7753 RepID=UPI002AB7A27C|nr:uncharacterized protein LOC133355618 isoform X5 [Lethenteron reissneri]
MKTQRRTAPKHASRRSTGLEEDGSERREDPVATRWRSKGQLIDAPPTSPRARMPAPLNVARSHIKDVRVKIIKARRSCRGCMGGSRRRPASCARAGDREPRHVDPARPNGVRCRRRLCRAAGRCGAFRRAVVLGHVQQCGARRCRALGLAGEGGTENVDSTCFVRMG